MSAETQANEITANGLKTPVILKQDGIMASQPNNDSREGLEQEEWMDEREEDCHHHNIIGNIQTRKNRGGYEPASALDQVDDACIDPTSSVKSNSDAADNSSSSSFQRIALTFSTQGLGFVSVPLLAYPLLELGCDADVIWRVLLGVGALPGIVVLYLRLFSNNSRDCKGDNETNHHVGNARQNDDIEEIGDDHDPVGTIDNTAPKLQEESQPSLKTKNGHGHDIMPSALFCDVSGQDRNIHDEHDNELSLVEHSYTSSDNIDREKQTEHRDDVSDDPPTTPLRNRTPGLWESIRTEPDLGRKFAGTAGTWFLFDVLFYGNTLFEPLVIEAAFGSHASADIDGYKLLQNTVRASLLITLLALPGYFVTVIIIGRRTCVCGPVRSTSSRLGSASCFPCEQTPVYIQMQGFFVMFILYSIIGLFWNSLLDIPWLLLLLYAGSFFMANYGPNTTTFMLPSVTYSEECRSTLNGVSAAAGKLGALVGAGMFTPATDVWGISVVMMICGFVSLVAWMLTFFSLGTYNFRR